MTTSPQIQEFERTLLEYIRQYAVILHNDETHSMDFVVESLMKSVPGLTQPEAIDIMLETHENGRGVVIVCPLEPAEHYRDRIKSFKLGCSIEEA